MSGDIGNRPDGGGNRQEGGGWHGSNWIFALGIMHFPRTFGVILMLCGFLATCHMHS